MMETCVVALEEGEKSKLSHTSDLCGPNGCHIRAEHLCSSSILRQISVTRAAAQRIKGSNSVDKLRLAMTFQREWEQALRACGNQDDVSDHEVVNKTRS